MFISFCHLFFPPGKIFYPNRLLPFPIVAILKDKQKQTADNAKP